ncbi:MAG TPA: RodZ domain-containing protein [Candidatus Dormibacteraeota bacterium]|nr:RodZ domain-containing protein [Candidatus Dormibacteraeota bacterium]
MTKRTFGENLKREREMRGVTLEEISVATRIATRFLQAIENEQWDQLPGGVFNRGFVRAVAHYLGLDEENVVAEYAAAVNDRPSVPVWTGSPPAVAPDRPWLAWILAIIVIFALIAGGWFATQRILQWRAARRTTRGAATAVAPSLAAKLELRPQGVSAIASTDTANGSDVATAAAPAPASSAPTTGAASAPLELKVEAGKKTKVTVLADDDRVFAGTMKAGENRVFSAKNRFEVSARDAGALLLELNGKMLAPIGPPGRAGKVALTRKALKDAAGGGN